MILQFHRNELEWVTENTTVFVSLRHDWKRSLPLHSCCYDVTYRNSSMFVRRNMYHWIYQHVVNQKTFVEIWLICCDSRASTWLLHLSCLHWIEAATALTILEQLYCYWDISYAIWAEPSLTAHTKMLQVTVLTVYLKLAVRFILGNITTLKLISKINFP